MTWVKICANTNLEDATLAVDAGADALGFIFAPSTRRVAPKDVRRITDQLPTAIEKIGVFINQRPESILETILAAGLTGVQLHGIEELDNVRQLRKLATKAGRPKLSIYKGLHARELMPDQHGSQYGIGFVKNASDLVDAFLMDSGTPERRGGTGKTFDWDEAAPMIKLLARKHRVVIAGGLNPQNVRRAIQVFSPWGVDVVTGVESEPGKKDHAKLQAFMASVRNGENK
jgi:phosphoribosylanthranilate isomerase